MIQVIDRTKRVYGIGSNVIDVIYRVNRIAGPDEKVYVVPNDDGKTAREIAGAACCLVDGAFPHLDRSLPDVRALYSGPAIGSLI